MELSKTFRIMNSWKYPYNSSYGYGFSLRFITLLSKFIFLIYFSKTVEIEEIASYGLIIGFITVSLYMAGFEVYTITSRQFIKEPSKTNFIVSNQFAMYFLGYIVALPFLYISTTNFSPNIQFLCMMILVSEHINQELNRILIALNKILLAGINLFIRSGFWVYIFIFVNEFLFLCTLKNILFIWLMCSLLALIIILVNIAKAKIRIILDFDLIWMKKVLYRAFPFLLSSISFQALMVYDRVSIQKLGQDTELAAYVFFMSLTMGIFSLYEATILTPNFRKIIIDGADTIILKKSIFKLFLMGIPFYIILTIFSFPFIEFLVGLTEKSALVSLSHWYYATSLVGLMLVLASTVTRGLYALEADYLISKINIFTFLIFVLAVFLGQTVGVQPIVVVHFLIAVLLLNFLMKLIKLILIKV